MDSTLTTGLQPTHYNRSPAGAGIASYPIKERLQHVVDKLAQRHAVILPPAGVEILEREILWVRSLQAKSQPIHQTLAKRVWSSQRRRADVYVVEVYGKTVGLLWSRLCNGIITAISPGKLRYFLKLTARKQSIKETPKTA